MTIPEEPIQRIGEELVSIDTASVEAVKIKSRLVQAADQIEEIRPLKLKKTIMKGFLVRAAIASSALWLTVAYAQVDCRPS